MPCSVPIPVRFRDLDALGHLNNAVYLSYIEVARLEYFWQVVAPHDPEANSPGNPERPRLMFARAEIDYLRPVLLRDQVVVTASITRVGNKSMTMEHVVLANGQVAARASTVLVWYNHECGYSEPVPAWARQTIEQFEQNIT
jgi:acyl-CoA thioester hydrolase